MKSTFKEEFKKIQELNQELQEIEKQLHLKQTYFAGMFEQFVKKYHPKSSEGKVALAELIALGIAHSND